MTHSYEKIGLCYATAKILQCGRKNKVALECVVEKNSRKKKTRYRRYIKNAQRHKITKHIKAADTTKK